MFWRVGIGHVFNGIKCSRASHQSGVEKTNPTPTKIGNPFPLMVSGNKSFAMFFVGKKINNS